MYSKMHIIALNFIATRHIKELFKYTDESSMKQQQNVANDESVYFKK